MLNVVDLIAFSPSAFSSVTFLYDPNPMRSYMDTGLPFFHGVSGQSDSVEERPIPLRKP